MGFLIFLPLILLGSLVGLVLEKIFTPFLPVLALLRDPVVFRVAMGVLLAVNVLFLVLLMTVRSRLARKGRMSRAYVRSRHGFARFKAAAVRNVLIFAIVWEFMLVLLFAFGLVVQPFQNAAPASTASRHPVFDGSWRVTACVAVTPDCTLSQEEIDACVGTVITYDTSLFEKDGAKYRDYKGLTVSGVYCPMEKYHYTSLTADEFQAQFQFPAADLGYKSYVMSHATLTGEAEAQLGQEIVGWWLYWQGAFFQAEQIEEGLT